MVGEYGGTKSLSLAVKEEGRDQSFIASARRHLNDPTSRFHHFLINHFKVKDTMLLEDIKELVHSRKQFSASSTRRLHPRRSTEEQTNEHSTWAEGGRQLG